jgi:hypothetical protein
LITFALVAQGNKAMSRNSLAQCLGLVSTLVVSSVLLASSADAQEARDTSRIRIGVEGGAGGEWGTPRGASVGLYGQLGLQLNNTFALFYQPSLIIHALSDDSDESDVFVAFGNLGMLDLTFGALQLGVGGGIDVGRFTECDENGCDDGGSREVHPAIGGRVAAVIGVGTGRARLGIPIGLQIHSTFLNEDTRVTSLVLTVGIQRF